MLKILIYNNLNKALKYGYNKESCINGVIFGIMDASKEKDMATQYYPELEPFAKRLRILRNTKSRHDIAHDLGIPESRYQSWEYCRASPSVANIAQIAKFHGVTADYLIGLSDEPHGLGGGANTATNANLASPGARVSLSPCKDCPHIATLNGTISSLSASLAAMSQALSGKA